MSKYATGAMISCCHCSAMISKSLCPHCGVNQRLPRPRQECTLANCDGTRLGHDLAKDFPEATARTIAAFAEMEDRARHPERYVDPKNLQVEE